MAGRSLAMTLMSTFYETINLNIIFPDAPVLIKRIPRCSASGLIKIPFDTSQLCCGVVHS